MPLILAVRDLCGEITLKDMHMIADINKIILNAEFMTKLLKENENG